MILSSHLLHLVEEICTRVLVMQARTSRWRSGRSPRSWPAGPALRGRRLEDVFLALITPDGRAADVIRVFAYLAWRSAHNRVSAPAPPAARARGTWPRSSSASPTSGSWRWSSGPQPAPADRRRRRAGSSCSARSAWWARCSGDGSSGSSAGCCRFTPAEVTFLFSGPVPRRGLVQYKLLRNQLLILFNSLLWTLILARERFGASPWLRALSIWVLLTTISFHRLGASFVRTSLLEHGRIALRHRVVSLVLLGAALIGDRVERAGRAARAGGRAGQAGLDNLPRRARRGGGRAAAARCCWRRSAPWSGRSRRTRSRNGCAGDGPRPAAAGAALRVGDPGGHRVRGGRGGGRPCTARARSRRAAGRRPPQPGVTAGCRRSSGWRRSAGPARAILWKNLLAVVRTRRATEHGRGLRRSARWSSARSRSGADGTIAEIAGWLATIWAGVLDRDRPPVDPERSPERPPQARPAAQLPAARAAPSSRPRRRPRRWC